MSKYDKYRKQIIDLHSEGLRNSEIAKEIGIDNRRVSEQIKKIGLEPNQRVFNDKPTPDEEKIFISMFIGDGAIYKSPGNVNYRVNLAHSDKQKEYFLMKYNRVKNFIGTEYFKETQYHKKAKKHYHAYKFQSKVNPYFTKMRKIWYKNGKKVIPDEIYKHLDYELLAYKFFDDGHNAKSGYSIAMNDYDNESVERFRDAMKINLGIETNLHKSGAYIYIPASQKSKFKKFVLPYATKDVLYKLGELSGTPNA